MMTNQLQKPDLEAWHGHVIHTQPWDAVAGHYRDMIAQGWPGEHFLQLVEEIAASPVSSELYAGTSATVLLISDCPEFHSRESVLRIAYRPADNEFDFHFTAFSGHDDQKTCSEAEALKTLRLFLRIKYGVLI